MFTVLAVTFLSASSLAANTPLYTVRMEQASSKMHFLPIEVNGFTYTTEKGYHLNYDVMGYCGVEPLSTGKTCDPETCEIETCDEPTCPWSCWQTCPYTCSPTCPQTCPYTCDDPTCITCEPTCNEPSCWETSCWETCEQLTCIVCIP
jgi:hypothetical protein